MIKKLLLKALQAHQEAGYPAARFTSSTPRKAPENWTRASELGQCATEAALKRRELPDPETLPTELFRSGSYSALIYQEALTYYASRTPGVGVRCEYPIELPSLGIIGTADIVIETLEEEPISQRMMTKQAVIEIKERDTVDTVRKSDALQVMTYKNALHCDAYILIHTRHKFNLYKLMRSREGYQLVDAETNKAVAPNYFWNGYVSDKEWEETVKDHVAALNEEVPTPRFNLNSSEAWRCFEINRKAGATTGTAKPRCTFAGRCHGLFSEASIEQINNQWQFSRKENK